MLGQMVALRQRIAPAPPWIAAWRRHTSNLRVAGQRTNVLVYAGDGADKDSLAQTLNTFRVVFRGHYDVQTVDARVLTREPWESSTAAVIMPGGRDVPMLQALGDAGMARLRAFVHQGGRYVGICAGAYLACAQISFEADRPAMAIAGPRPLAFFSGVATGAAYAGFEYDSEAGARVVPVRLRDGRQLEARFNGGCYFKGGTATVEAVYELPTRDGQLEAPAIVRAAVGDRGGAALLLGVHLEDMRADGPAGLAPAAARGNLAALAGLVSGLGLACSAGEVAAPTAEMYTVVAWGAAQPLALDAPYRAAPSDDTLDPTLAQFVETHARHHAAPDQFPGRPLLAATTLDSTQRVLAEPRHLAQLPDGAACVAFEQTAGRGRGAHSWISVAGCLQFSVLLRPPAGAKPASLVAVQYLVGLAVVEAVRAAAPNAPVFLKWPNDIYAVVRGHADPVKIGGVLIQSLVEGDRLALVVGIGLNVSNERPTASLLQAVPSLAPSWTLNVALAEILDRLGVLWRQYWGPCGGSFAPLRARYCKYWLHSGQRVRVSVGPSGTAGAVIEGLDDDGLLLARSVSDPAVLYRLQPDGNSFDMLSGLIAASGRR